MTKIKNIIFDLGGVIINLDIPLTIKEFNQFTHQPFEKLYNQLQQNELFDLFDKGLVSEQTFFKQLNELLGKQASSQQLLKAWNAMLLDFPLHRLQLLQNLKPKYRTFLLSNTNETHITAFENILWNEHHLKNLDTFFEKSYYSCRIGMRKPQIDIFQRVVQENNLNPHETLFIDDSPQHIEGAKKIGLQAILLDKNKDISTLLQELKIY